MQLRPKAYAKSKPSLVTKAFYGPHEPNLIIEVEEQLLLQQQSPIPKLQKRPSPSSSPKLLQRLSLRLTAERLARLQKWKDTEVANRFALERESGSAGSSQFGTCVLFVCK